MLEFRVLGSVDLRDGRDGRVIRSVLAQPKRFALFAYLVLARPRRFHHRTALLSTFWPEIPEEQGRHALRQAFYQLRQSLGESTVVARGDGEIGVDFGAVACDALAFDDAIESGQASAALELYGGELLAGFAIDGCREFEGWLERRREELRRHAVDAVIALPSGGALRWLDAAAGWAPYDERVVRRQIEVFVEAGRSGEALRAYDAFADRFRRELELEPSAETQALAASIRAVPAAPESAAAGAGATVPPEFSRIPWRWRTARLALAAVAVAAVILLVRRSPDTESGAPPAGAASPTRVLVMDFREPANGGGDALVARMATDWIAQGLMRTGMLEVVSGGMRLADSARRQTGLATLAAAAGAGSIVDGTVYRQDDVLVFQVRIADANGALRRAIEYRSPGGEPVLESVERLRQRVTGALAATVDARLATWEPAAGAPPSYEAYRHYIEGIERFDQVPTPPGAIAEAAASFRRAFELDTTFSAALVWAVLASQSGGPPAAELLAILQARRDTLPPWERHMTDFLAAMRVQDWEAGFHAMRRVNELAPGGDWAFWLAGVALSTGRPRTVLAALERVDPERYFHIPTWGSYCNTLLLGLGTLREYERALAELDRCQRLEPENRSHAYTEASLLAALGRGDEAAAAANRAFAEPGPPHFKLRAIASQINQLRTHGHPRLAGELAGRALDWYERGLTTAERDGIHPVRQAEFLYAAGRFDRARDVLLAAPDYPPGVASHLLGQLALTEARLGNREEAFRLWEELEAMNLGWQAAALRAIHRVRLAGLLLGPDETIRMLAEAWDSGETQRFVGLPANWLELQHLRDHPGFQALVRPRD
jgi:DNA-binding SARP family transcriptional activator